MNKGIYTKAERETTIRWDAQDKIATVWTCDPVVIRKLDRLCQSSPDSYTLLKQNEEYESKTYQVPARYVRFGKPLSEATKMKRRECLLKTLDR